MAAAAAGDASGAGAGAVPTAATTTSATAPPPAGAGSASAAWVERLSAPRLQPEWKDDFSHAPQISSRSKELAARAAARPRAQAGVVLDGLSIGDLARLAPGYEDFTFRPKLNATSQRLAAASGRSSSSVMDSKAQQQRREEARRKVAEEMAAGLTFAPKLCPATRLLLTGIKSTFLDRQQQHLQRQQARQARVTAASAVAARSGSGQSPTRMPAIGGRPGPKKGEPTRPLRRSKSLTSAPLPAAVPAARKQQAAVEDQAGEPLSPRRAPRRPKSGRVRARRRHSVAVSSGVDSAHVPYQHTPREPPCLSADRLRDLHAMRRAREEAVQAADRGKIYTVAGGYGGIRVALERRGWLAKPICRAEDTALLPHYDFTGIKLCKRKVKRSGDGEVDADTSGSDDSDQGDDGGPGGEGADSGDDAASPEAAAAAEDSAESQPQAGAIASEGDSGGGGGEDGGGPQAELEAPRVYTLAEKALSEFPTNLFFCNRQGDIHFRTLQPNQITNHFKKNSSITTKSGLTASLRWLTCFESTDPNTFYPRCFTLSNPDERLDFVDRYRLCALAALFQRTAEWAPPAAVVQLALKAWRAHLSFCSYSDLDGDEIDSLSETDWEALLLFVYNNTGSRGLEAPAFAPLQLPRTHAQKLSTRPSRGGDDSSSDEGEGPSPTEADRPGVGGSTRHRSEAGAALLAELTQDSTPLSPELTRQVQGALEEMAEQDVQFGVSGSLNMWVVKPAAMSRGRGIFCENRLDMILAATRNPAERWVAQKYIETPMLIHGVKFDIRQWFVVTSWNPLTVWVYRDSYLRFSGTTFDLSDIRSEQSRFVHLCNNSVQKTDSVAFDKLDFAEGQMWTSRQFQDHLAAQGQPEAWELIHARLVAVLHEALKSAQDVVESRRNSFELYGADFILDSDMRPWLIEINASPSMSTDTPATAELVPRVLEDLVKVVVDRRKDRSADTGGFEMTLRQAKLKVPLGIVTKDLCLTGAPIRKKLVYSPRKPQAVAPTFPNDEGSGSDG